MSGPRARARAPAAFSRLFVRLPHGLATLFAEKERAQLPTQRSKGSARSRKQRRVWHAPRCRECGCGCGTSARRPSGARASGVSPRGSTTLIAAATGRDDNMARNRVWNMLLAGRQAPGSPARQAVTVAVGATLNRKSGPSQPPQRRLAKRTAQSQSTSLSLPGAVGRSSRASPRHA